MLLFANVVKSTAQFWLFSSTPNFTLAPAVDVLTTGAYPRLPACVRDKIVPLPPLTGDQSQEAFYLIDCAVRRRLLGEQIPLTMKVKSIGKCYTIIMCISIY